jgi:hypothetical protein
MTNLEKTLQEPVEQAVDYLRLKLNEGPLYGTIWLPKCTDDDCAEHCSTFQ